jgi:hypothetical protein
MVTIETLLDWYVEVRKINQITLLAVRSDMKKDQQMNF